MEVEHDSRCDSRRRKAPMSSGRQDRVAKIHPPQFGANVFHQASAFMRHQTTHDEIAFVQWNIFTPIVRGAIYDYPI
jgi:hypothetical protein